MGKGKPHLQRKKGRSQSRRDMRRDAARFWPRSVIRVAGNTTFSVAEAEAAAVLFATSPAAACVFAPIAASVADAAALAAAFWLQEPSAAAIAGAPSPAAAVVSGVPDSARRSTFPAVAGTFGPL